MRVIICGAGQVGYNIAAQLAQEGNDVTVIDLDVQLISQINDDLDVNGIVGYASNPDILKTAGASDANMLISVTQSDEVNMITCQIAHSLFGVPKKIARIREQAYLQPEWSNLFSRAHMPIDVIISPEVAIANDIYKRMAVPGTTYVASLADNKVFLLGVLCDEDCPIINTPLSQIHELFPNLDFKIIAISRNSQPIVPDEFEQLQEGDEVFFIVSADHVRRVMAAFGHEDPESRRIVIAGGGNIGYYLAKLLLEQNRGVSLKMIERNEKRASFLSENLEGAVILNGNSLDRDVLEDAAITTAQTYIAVTNDDESNILGSLLAKQHGCKNAVTLVNNNIYSSFIGPLGIDMIVSPRLTIAATVLQHVRKGRIKALHQIREGFAEVIEAEISDSSNLVNTAVHDVNLPGEVIIGAVVREQEVIVSLDPDFIIRAGDHVIILASKEQVRNIEKMLSVQVDIF